VPVTGASTAANPTVLLDIVTQAIAKRPRFAKDLWISVYSTVGMSVCKTLRIAGSGNRLEFVCRGSAGYPCRGIPVMFPEESRVAPTILVGSLGAHFQVVIPARFAASRLRASRAANRRRPLIQGCAVRAAARSLRDHAPRCSDLIRPRLRRRLSDDLGTAASGRTGSPKVAAREALRRR